MPSNPNRVGGSTVVRSSSCRMPCREPAYTPASCLIVPSSQGFLKCLQACSQASLRLRIGYV